MVCIIVNWENLELSYIFPPILGCRTHTHLILYGQTVLSPLYSAESLGSAGKKEVPKKSKILPLRDILLPPSYTYAPVFGDGGDRILLSDESRPCNEETKTPFWIFGSIHPSNPSGKPFHFEVILEIWSSGHLVFWTLDFRLGGSNAG